MYIFSEDLHLLVVVRSYLYSMWVWFSLGSAAGFHSVRTCEKIDVRPSVVNNCFKSLLLLQFSINLNQTWQKVRTHGGAKNVGSGILNFCLWVEKSRRLCQFLSIYSNRYSSYVSQPILTKLGTKLEPIGRQKMLGAEFWFLLLCGKKQTTLLSFTFFQSAALFTILMQFKPNVT